MDMKQYRLAQLIDSWAQNVDQRSARSGGDLLIGFADEFTHLVGEIETEQAECIDLDRVMFEDLKAFLAGYPRRLFPGEDGAFYVHSRSGIEPCYDFAKSWGRELGVLQRHVGLRSSSQQERERSQLTRMFRDMIRVWSPDLPVAYKEQYLIMLLSYLYQRKDRDRQSLYLSEGFLTKVFALLDQEELALAQQLSRKLQLCNFEALE